MTTNKTPVFLLVLSILSLIGSLFGMLRDLFYLMISDLANNHDYDHWY